MIAQFPLLNRDSLSQTIISSDISDLRDLSRQRESPADQMSSTKSEIQRLLTITFPELEQMAGVFSKSMLRLLGQYPSAASINQAKRSKIAKILIPGSYGKQPPCIVRPDPKGSAGIGWNIEPYKRDHPQTESLLIDTAGATSSRA